MLQEARTDADEFLTLLGSVTGLGVYDCQAPDGAATPYCVVYPDPGVRTLNRLCRTPDGMTTTVQVTYVGGDRNEAVWAADHGCDVLVGTTPTIAGKVCWPIWQDTAQPVRRDDQTRTADGRQLYYCPIVYKLMSTPA